MDTVTSTAIKATVVLVVFSLLKRGWKKRSLPPGPIGLPLVGNAPQLPKGKLWVGLSEWAKVYGDIFHLDILGTPYIVVSSAKIVNELLDKRSAIYSDRPHMVFLMDLAGFDESLTLQPHKNPSFKMQRRHVASTFNNNHVATFRPIQEREARLCVRRLLQNTSRFKEEIQLTVGKIIMRVTYGYTITSLNDPLLVNALKSIDNFSKGAVPGAFAVDIIPALRYLPEWLPGTGFFQVAKEYKQTMIDAVHEPFYWAKENLATGKSLLPNMCDKLLGEFSPDARLSDTDLHDMVWGSGTVLGAGLDSSVATLLSFMLAMLLHPEVQQKAQKELEDVVGKDRLPSIDDRPHLPYTRGVLIEVARWATVFPLSIPHATTEDDIYEGMFIPKGSNIIPNVWHMLHDPASFPDPMAFKPERYKGLDAEMEKVTDLAFGFGRRSCSGRQFAEGTFFAVAATLLATCRILPALDENGREVTPVCDFTPATISFPQDFSMRLESRSKETASLLEEVSLELE